MWTWLGSGTGWLSSRAEGPSPDSSAARIRCKRGLVHDWSNLDLPRAWPGPRHVMACCKGGPVWYRDGVSQGGHMQDALEWRARAHEMCARGTVDGFASRPVAECRGVSNFRLGITNFVEGGEARWELHEAMG